MAVGINIASRKYSFPTEKQRTMMKSEWFVFSLWAISNKTRSIVLLLTKDIPSIKRHPIHQKLKTTTSKWSDEIGWCDKTEEAVETRIFEALQVSFGQRFIWKLFKNMFCDSPAKVWQMFYYRYETEQLLFPLSSLVKSETSFKSW